MTGLDPIIPAQDGGGLLLWDSWHSSIAATACPANAWRFYVPDAAAAFDQELSRTGTQPCRNADMEEPADCLDVGLRGYVAAILWAPGAGGRSGQRISAARPRPQRHGEDMIRSKRPWRSALEV